jgi:hypothetical protein
MGMFNLPVSEALEFASALGVPWFVCRGWALDSNEAQQWLQVALSLSERG